MNLYVFLSRRKNKPLQLYYELEKKISMPLKLKGKLLMKSNIHFILLNLVIFSAFYSCKPTKNLTKIDEAKLSENMELSFPEDAVGYWLGEISIFQDTGLVQKVPMALDIFEIGETGVWAWHIIYNPGKNEDKRKYLLIEVNKEKGHYQIDEDNGIILDAYLLNNKLISSFSVSNSTLQTINTFLDSQMVFEVIAGPQKSINTSGNMKVEENEIPPVDSYQLSTYQRAILSKKRG